MLLEGIFKIIQGGNRCSGIYIYIHNQQCSPNFFPCNTLVSFGHLLTLGVDQEHCRLQTKLQTGTKLHPRIASAHPTPGSKGAEVFGYKPWAICVYSSHLETAHKSGGAAGEPSFLQKKYLFQQVSGIFRFRVMHHFLLRVLPPVV